MLHERGAMLTGLGLGVGLMYFLDPDRGRRRRALVRDQLARASRVSGAAIGTLSRDMAHRASGVAARARGALQRDSADDHVVAERVRSQLGRTVSHPRAIQVDVRNGVITLSGPVLQAEVPRLLRAVEHVRGVREVVNALEEHEQAGHVPALQGGSAPPGLWSEIWSRGWSPTTRLVAGTAGTALTGYGAVLRDLRGALLAATGLGLLTRAATNLQARRLTEVGTR
jgi:hypothetical protein